MSGSIQSSASRCDLGRNPACRAVPSVRYSPHVPVVQLMQIFLVPAYTKPPRQLG